MEHTSVAQQWINANHTENTTSPIVAFTARCIAAEAIRLLPAYSMSRSLFTESFPINGSTCHNIILQPIIVIFPYILLNKH
jgi:hypothetical protein